MIYNPLNKVKMKTELNWSHMFSIIKHREIDTGVHYMFVSISIWARNLILLPG